MLYLKRQIKMKKVKMTNLEFIKRWETNELENITQIVMDGEIFSELDEENKIVYMEDGSEISFDDLEKYTVYVNELVQVELDFDVKEFYKDIEQAKKLISKDLRGHGLAFFTNGEQIISEEILNEWNDLGELFDAFERGLELYDSETIEICNN
jgi:uncharacterized protein YacL (UPF0231 family)